MRKLLIVPILCLIAYAAYALTVPFTITVGSGDFAFTPLHLYFIDNALGSDGNDGTAPVSGGGHGPWLTPNHSVVCGDVILVKAGSNSGGWTGGQWGTVSGCPSTSAGIDGNGGIQFAVVLCAGATLGTCNFNGGGNEAFRIDKSHWAVEGFNATQNTNAQGSCFSAENDANPVQKYVAFINDIAAVCDLAGFSSSGDGCVGCGGFDLIAAVGVVSFDGANSIQSLCGSGISFIPGNPDNSVTGTHIYVSQYFGSSNSNRLIGGSECTASGLTNNPHSDGEGLIFDTYGAGSTTPGNWNVPAVVENAVIWNSGNDCIQAFPQGNGTTNDQGQYIVLHITCYANEQDARAACAGELHWNGIYPTGTGNYKTNNSIFFMTVTSCGGAGTFNISGAAELDAESGHVTILDATRIDVSNNWIWQSHAPTSSTVGPPNTFVVDNTTHPQGSGCDNSGSPPCFNAVWHFGTNTYGDPGMTNPSALFTTSPDCSAYTNVQDCMQTGFGVYAKVTPTIAPTTMGYQPVSACAPNTNYPTWLKGIVYLRASGYTAGATITEKAGLATKPCNS